MKSLTLICLLFLFTAPTFAQSKDPVSDALRKILASRAKDTIAAFEKLRGTLVFEDEPASFEAALQATKETAA